MKKMAESRLMNMEGQTSRNGILGSNTHSILQHQRSQYLAAARRRFDLPEHDDLHDPDDLEAYGSRQ